MSESYHPEEYWSKVGSRIESRESGKNVIAGDDEPYYRYKRQEFLKLLNALDFIGKSVLEIGHGPGGNLLEIYKHKPAELQGVDISDQMVKLAKNKVPQDVTVQKINGTQLPFSDNHFDIVFSATVLQHNTDDAMMRQLLNEMARVSKKNVVLFERIENQIKGDELCLGRPVSYYQSLMNTSGFDLESAQFINIRISYYVSGIIRKLLNPNSRKEGEPLTRFSEIMQKVTLPITSVLDKMWTSNKDIGRLIFRKREYVL